MKHIGYVLESVGFVKHTVKEVYEKVLFGDFSISVSTEDSFTDEDGFINIYIHSSTFNDFMNFIFKNKKTAETISPRKLKKDTLGTLCMVSSEFEINEGLIKLWLGGEPYGAYSFFDNLSKIDNVHDFYNEIFVNYNWAFVWFEGVWVFFYLTHLCGMSVSSCVDELNRKEYSSIRRDWHLHVSLNANNIHKLKQLFKN